MFIITVDQLFLYIFQDFGKISACLVHFSTPFFNILTEEFCLQELEVTDNINCVDAETITNNGIHKIGISWRVADEETLFQYPMRVNEEELKYHPLEFNIQLLERARTICEQVNRLFCLLSVKLKSLNSNFFDIFASNFGYVHF